MDMGAPIVIQGTVVRPLAILRGEILLARIEIVEGGLGLTGTAWLPLPVFWSLWAAETAAAETAESAAEHDVRPVAQEDRRACPRCKGKVAIEDCMVCAAVRSARADRAEGC